MLMYVGDWLALNGSTNRDQVWHAVSSGEDVASNTTRTGISGNGERKVNGMITGVVRYRVELIERQRNNSRSDEGLVDRIQRVDIGSCGDPNRNHYAARCGIHGDTGRRTKRGQQERCVINQLSQTIYAEEVHRRFELIDR